LEPNEQSCRVAQQNIGRKRMRMPQANVEVHQRQSNEGETVTSFDIEKRFNPAEKETKSARCGGGLVARDYSTPITREKKKQTTIPVLTKGGF